MRSTSTKQDLLVEAQKLLHLRGYDSFSFQDLADKVGIRKASVHTHYKDKEELGIKVVEKLIEDFKAWQAFHAQKTGLEQLKSFMRMLKKYYVSQAHLCANGAFFSDWGLLPQSLQRKVLELQETQLNWMSTCLEDAQKKKQIDKSVPAALRAQILFVSVVGAIQAARAWKNPQLLDQVVEQQLGVTL